MVVREVREVREIKEVIETATQTAQEIKDSIKAFDNGTDRIVNKKIDTWLIMTNMNDSKIMARGNRTIVGKAIARQAIAGKIIARYTRTLTVLSITFFETDSTPDVGTLEIMDGCGNDITAHGIGSLLWRLREDLAKWHGIRFTCPETDMISRWQQELEQNGYVVIKKNT